MTVDEACSIPRRFGAEKGWTDTEEYIRKEDTSGFLLMGRWFLKQKDGTVESLE